MNKFKIVLADNSVKYYNSKATFRDIAMDISEQFYKKTLAVIFNGNILNLNSKIYNDGKVNFILDSNKDYKYIILNNSAILLLSYILQKKYPGLEIYNFSLQDKGFYVDIFSKKSISKNDFSNIENEIIKIINQNTSIFPDNKINKILDFQLDYKDMNCITIDSTKKQGKIKLLEISGLHTDNDTRGLKAQRIYGYAAKNNKEINEYIDYINKQKENDHRTLGNELELFSFDEMVGSGLPIWLPKGTILRRKLEEYIIDLETKHNYQHVNTPILGNKKLYETSGHLDHYKEDIFPPIKLDNEEFILRPMNCPHHMIVYKQQSHSYRDLPLRIAELGLMHRNEKSGGLIGLERVRSMCLNDAHIFLTQEQIKEEFLKILQLIKQAYKDLNIVPLYYRLSLRDPKNTEKYYKDDSMWNNTENYLRNILNNTDIKVVEAIGEAAFYGPKVDIQVKNVNSHEFTLSTIQLDFLLPQKFNLYYIDEKGEKKRPVIIHRSILSTMERLSSYLIERYKGLFPLWLAPVQVEIIPIFIKDHLIEYAKQIQNILLKNNIRSHLDLTEEKFNYKLRKSQVKKIPLSIVLGNKEYENKYLTYRIHGSKDAIKVTLEEFLEKLKTCIHNKTTIDKF